MSETHRIACLQTMPQPTFDSSLDEAWPLFEAAVKQGAELIALPEYCGGLVSDGPMVCPPTAPERSHPVLLEFQKWAMEHEVWILVGSLAVGEQMGRFSNRSLMINAKGDIAGLYDKVHLFDIELSEDHVYRESDTVNSGDELVLCRTPAGTVGMTICYDLRFAHYYRASAQNGADILAIPAAFTKVTGEKHWHVLNRARAIETGCYVISPCAYGPVPGGGECYGHSLIVDPWGQVLADGGVGRGIIVADIDIGRVVEARQKIPSIKSQIGFNISYRPDWQ